MMNILARLAVVAVLASAATGGCRHEEKFPSLGTAIVSPVDVASSDDGALFYVLNADMDRTYNTGSVLVLDKDGNRLNAVPVPRMGRSLTVADKDMLVSVDYTDLEKGAKLFLYNLDDPKSPRLVKEWPLPCSPFNAVMRKSYKYFAFTCVDGQVFIGELTDDRAQSQLHMVRHYGYSRRALHLDPKRGLLFGFATDASKQTWSDLIALDIETHDPKTGLLTSGTLAAPVPNEVPDRYEESEKALTTEGSRQIHQFYVYDIAKEAALGFPDRPGNDPYYGSELRWLYFNLNNFDGTPDRNLDGLDGSLDANYKYYRTNFWSAQPDPEDPNVFYLSHRGPPAGKDGSTGSPNANDIVKVSIVGDPHAVPKTTAVTEPDPSTGQTITHDVTVEIAPFTSTFFGFDRVYGFKGAETTKLDYPGDFRIAQVSGQKILLVNNFRDLVNWVRGDTYYSLAAATLDDDSLWFDESCRATEPSWGGCTNTDPNWSWYQVAVNNEGRALSLSFYGNAVMLLDVRPGLGIKLVKRIQ